MKTEQDSFWKEIGAVIGDVAEGLGESRLSRECGTARVRRARSIDRDTVDVGGLIRHLKNTHGSHRQLQAVEAFCADRETSITCESAARILETFNFDTYRHEAVKMLWICIVDKRNAYKICDAFTFSVSVSDFD